MFETNIKQDIIDNIPNTRILESSVHGMGLFSASDISADKLLCILDGQVISWDLHKKLNLCSEWNAVSKNLLMVRAYQTKYFAINHSRSANLIIKDRGHGVAIYTTKFIKNNTELFLDYRDQPLPDEYIEGHGKSYL